MGRSAHKGGEAAPRFKGKCLAANGITARPSPPPQTAHNTLFMSERRGEHTPGTSTHSTVSSPPSLSLPLSLPLLIHLSSPLLKPLTQSHSFHHLSSFVLLCYACHLLSFTGLSLYSLSLSPSVCLYPPPQPHLCTKRGRLSTITAGF